MRIHSMIAIAGGIALCIPAGASADDGFKYETMIHCAAIHMTATSILGMNGGNASNKDTIDTLNKQAAALMTFASLDSKKDTDTVMGEVTLETAKVQTKIAQDSAGTDYFKTEFEECNDWGKAAVVAINTLKDGK